MSHETNVEIFINKQLDVIQSQASSRSREHKGLRDACQELKDLLRGGEFGTPGSHLAIPFTAEVTDSLISVLRSALAQDTPKITEPALACLHKLVAYAYLQGETRPSGRLDDTTSLVTSVVGMTVKAGASTTASVQLSVVKTLLTLATAEHFMCHGDTLMQAARTVFNIAVGGAAEDIKSTAKSALLQMLNTIVKRVSQQIMTPGGTPMISPVQNAFKDVYEEDTGSPLPAAWPGTSGAITPELIKDDNRSSGFGGAQGRRQGLQTQEQQVSLSPAELTIALEHQSKLPRIRTNASHDNAEDLEVDAAAAAATTAAAQQQKHVEDTRTAQLASLAEQADLRGLEQAMAALPLHSQNSQIEAGARSQAPFTFSDRGSDSYNGVVAGVVAGGSTSSLNEGPPLSPSASAAAALREIDAQESSTFAGDGAGGGFTTTPPPGYQDKNSSDISGGTAEAELSSSATKQLNRSEKLLRVDTPPDPRRALMKERRAAEWRRLTVPERDAIIVIHAMCKLAARETGIGAGETYMHVGKLLALDMLVKVLTNPVHDWSQVRREFSHQLRQPLCLALLRNCMSPYNQAVDAAVSILTAIIASPRLREFLKAEVGALYPLLLLRPLEAERPESPHQVLAALTGLAGVCSSPQVLVDIFVNYDCNLQAANLFERTVKLLAKYVQLGTSSGSGSSAAKNSLPAAAVPKARATALKALLAAVKSMDTWAGPLKEEIKESTPQSATAADAEAEAAAVAGSSSFSSPMFPQDQLDPGTKHLHHDVLHKIQTDKAIKSNLEVGIEAFNRNPIKGLKTLTELGVLGVNDPSAAALFLREHSDRLDPTAVGELFGHQDDFNIAVMHAYIENEKFSGLAVDTALRSLLFNFRLPGEAQKIDRIIEKFAARYCVENPGMFATADAPYLLAFAIIMLHTDAHNPMAEARISSEDFVTMCVYQTEAGEYEEILPAEEVQQLYKRIVAEEIAVRKSAVNVVAGGAANGASGGVNNNTGGNNDNNYNKKGDLSRRARLAAAVGLTQLAAPFWAGASWDKQHGVDVERQRLLELTGQLLSTPGAGAGMGINAVPGSGTMWHAATHAEHARPMMQVSGVAVGKALATALSGASNLIEAMAILDGYEQAIRLAALLRLENLCETLVAGLAAAARLGAPAPPHTPEEARQVASLSRLISLGSCSEAGALGSAWVIILRALSELEALKLNLATSSSSSHGGTGSGAGGGIFPSSAAALNASGALAPRPTTSPTVLGSSTTMAMTTISTATPDSSSSSSSFLSRLFNKSDADNTFKPTTTIVSERRGPLSVQTGPGMGAVLWAETAGALPIDRIFTESDKLDGEAILTFFRALCAVSQEELDPGVPGAVPKVYLLQRLVECAARNTERIRLVWQRLWTVVSQHIVSAACHSDSYISMFAVDALRQLADKLLCRAEIAGFTAQGDALRPFSAVLRCSDNPSVRELAVACVSHAVGTHTRRIGSGWKAVLECLAVAAADLSPAVVSQALDALSTVFMSLYADDEGDGHGCLRECMCAVMAAVSNVSPEVQDLVPTALYMVQILARRLAEETSSNSSTNKINTIEGGGVKEAWLAILCPLAAVARSDPRPKESDTAAAVLFQIIQTHSAAIPVEIWEDIFDGSIGPMLALCIGTTRVVGAAAAAAAAAGGSVGAVSPTITRRASTPAVALSMPLPIPSVDRLSPEGMKRVLRHANTHLPDLWSMLATSSCSTSSSGQHTTTTTTTSTSATTALLRPSLRLLRTYADSSDENAASLGTRQLHALLHQAGPRLSASSWKDVEAVVGGMLLIPDLNDISTSPSSDTTPDDDSARAETMGILRRRCRSSLLALRCVGELLQEAPGSMPAEVQLRFLASLERVVEAATAVNDDLKQRKVLARLLDAEERYYTSKEYSSSSRYYREENTPGVGVGGRGHGGQNGATTTKATEMAPSSSSSSSVNGAATTSTTPTPITTTPTPTSTTVAGLAAAVRAEAGDWDDQLFVLPSFLRHEVEGGRILIGALRRCVSHPAALEGGEGDGYTTLQALQKECEGMLVSLALRTVSNAAAQISPMGVTSSPRSGNACGGGGAAEDAVRAALVRDALLALNELPSSAWQDKRSEVFAQAAKLVCSTDLVVRKAVQTLMRSQATAVLLKT
ncbi:hypothetical protein Ndes2526B_g03682 [Nannochloris sp. 'desiccata']